MPPPAATPAEEPLGALAGTIPTQTVYGRTEPTRREISDRAYFIYLARGGVNGDPVSDWIQAERELREELRQSARAGRRF
jgi:hypothetical protein